jgi:isocitrate lyase
MTWQGFNQADVEKLRGRLKIEYTLAKYTANKFRNQLRKAFETKTAIRSLGAATGNQAIQMADAGLEAIYLSGWQTAADNNLSGHMYPDQSLYPANSAPALCQTLNNALQRADQIEYLGGIKETDYYLPIVADAEAGFGGNLNAYEIMKAFIEAGAAAVHFEDQLSSAKKCGHLGGKVLVPTQEFINKLKAARLAADVMDVPTVLIARTDANSAKLITSAHDAYDNKFIPKEYSIEAARDIPLMTSEGFYRTSGGLEMAIARGLAYAPYADLIWCETSKPDLDEAKKFAESIHNIYPSQMLAYNCSPSFNWKANRDKAGELLEFQNKLAKMGYCYQFITLAGFHNLNLGMFKLARDYKNRGMAAYSEMQEEEFVQAELGFGAVKHQYFVGTSYFDTIQNIVGASETTAMKDSTETEQF